MNRIRFRAWYPEKQKMYEVAKVDMWGDPDQATCDLAAVDEELFDIYLNEVETMQYIGVKDKYNREILSRLISALRRAMLEMFARKHSEKWDCWGNED